MDNVGKPVESLCIKHCKVRSQKKKSPNVIHRTGEDIVRALTGKTSDDVENFVHKPVENQGLAVEKMWINSKKRAA